MGAIKIGSTFSGYGGLELGVALALAQLGHAAEVAWHCEVEPAPSKVLAHRWPNVPNLGDITTVGWATVEPVDIICGGSPCQDVSHAGRRAGMREGTRSGLWASMREGIATLRPRFVVWENVRGVLSAEADSELEPCPGCMGDGDDGPVLRALGRVLGDLADLGYDAQWRGLRAADVGAPHRRSRIFVVATDATASFRGRGRGGHEAGDPAERRRAHVGGRPIAADADDAGPQGREPAQRRQLPDWGAAADAERGQLQRRGEPGAVGSAPAEAGGTRDQRQRDGHAAGRRGATTPDADRDGQQSIGRVQPVGRDADGRGREDRPRPEAERTAWGIYEPAIRRWERLTRPAPAPTEPAPKGGRRLSPRFEEWMMGLPDGWVCDVPGVTRNEQMKALGNGVVPQQAAAAVVGPLTAALGVDTLMTETG